MKIGKINKTCFLIQKIVVFLLLSFNFLFSADSFEVIIFRGKIMEFFDSDRYKAENKEDITKKLELILTNLEQKVSTTVLNKEFIDFLFFFNSFLEELDLKIIDKELFLNLKNFVENLKKSHLYIELLLKYKVICFLEEIDRVESFKDKIKPIFLDGSGIVAMSTVAIDFIRTLKKEFYKSGIQNLLFYSEFFEPMLTKIYEKKISFIWEDDLFGEGNSRWDLLKIPGGLLKIKNALPTNNEAEIKVWQNYAEEFKELRTKDLSPYKKYLDSIKTNNLDFCVSIIELLDTFYLLLDCYKNRESDWGKIIFTITGINNDYGLFYNYDNKNYLKQNFFDTIVSIESRIAKYSLEKKENSDSAEKKVAENLDFDRDINLVTESNLNEFGIQPSTLPFFPEDFIEESDDQETNEKLNEAKKIDTDNRPLFETLPTLKKEQKAFLLKGYDDLIPSEHEDTNSLNLKSEAVPKERSASFFDNSVVSGSLIGLFVSYTLSKILRKNGIKKSLPFIFSGLGIGGFLGGLKQYYKFGIFKSLKKEKESVPLVVGN